MGPRVPYIEEEDGVFRYDQGCAELFPCGLPFLWGWPAECFPVHSTVDDPHVFFWDVVVLRYLLFGSLGDRYDPIKPGIPPVVDAVMEAIQRVERSCHRIEV